jgi:hypothetical protein
MIGTEFGRLVATGAGIFAFLFLMSYLRLRREATKSATHKREVWGAPAAGRVR